MPNLKKNQGKTNSKAYVILYFLILTKEHAILYKKQGYGWSVVGVSTAETYLIVLKAYRKYNHKMGSPLIRIALFLK